MGSGLAKVVPMFLAVVRATQIEMNIIDINAVYVKYALVDGSQVTVWKLGGVVRTTKDNQIVLLSPEEEKEFRTKALLLPNIVGKFIITDYGYCDYVFYRLSDGNTLEVSPSNKLVIIRDNLNPGKYISVSDDVAKEVLELAKKDVETQLTFELESIHMLPR